MNNNQELILTSQEVRNNLIKRVEVLDKIKAVPLFPGKMFVGIEQAANYYGVGEDAIKSIIRRNREELESDNVTIVKGEELKTLRGECEAKNVTYIGSKTRAYTTISKRALLRIGMLLTKSEVASAIRDYLLNIEEDATPEQKQDAIAKIEENTSKIYIANLRDEVRELQLNTRKEELLARKELALVNKLTKKATMYGLSKIEIAKIIETSLLKGTDAEVAILNEINTIIARNTTMARGSINAMVYDLAKDCFEEDIPTAWHALSAYMKTIIGINMETLRTRAKKKHGEKSPLVPSYLDLIAEYKAEETAKEAIAKIRQEYLKK